MVDMVSPLSVIRVIPDLPAGKSLWLLGVTNFRIGISAAQGRIGHTADGTRLNRAAKEMTPWIFSGHIG
jgi:hypothetical protein